MPNIVLKSIELIVFVLFSALSLVPLNTNIHLNVQVPDSAVSTLKYFQISRNEFSLTIITGTYLFIVKYERNNFLKNLLSSERSNFIR